MTESDLDRLRMLTLSDKQGDMSVPEVVKPHWLTHRIAYRGKPDSPAEVRAAQRAT